MKKKIKKRNPIALDLRTNGLYRPKVFKNRKRELEKFDIRKYMTTREKTSRVFDLSQKNLLTAVHTQCIILLSKRD